MGPAPHPKRDLRGCPRGGVSMISIARRGGRMGKALLALLALAFVGQMRAQQPAGNTFAAPQSQGGETTQKLQQHVDQLESEVEDLREQVKEMRAAMAGKSATASSDPAEHSTVDVPAASLASSAGSLTPEDRSVLDFLKG